MRMMLLSTLLLAACSSMTPYQLSIQQGNLVPQETVSKLKQGMTRNQVRFLLGTPVLKDPFHANRWDYTYQYHAAGQVVETRHLVVWFEGDQLSKVEGEGRPDPRPPAGVPLPSNR